MPVEQSADHPTYTLGTTTITSFAAPSRGADEVVLYRADLPANGGLPPHHHDHMDVFTVVAGGGVFHIDDEAFDLVVGDSVMVPIGALHYLEAGPEGASIVVTMLAGTKLVRADGSETVPAWVS